jgi:hypothetical protein
MSIKITPKPLLENKEGSYLSKARDLKSLGSKKLLKYF